MDVGPLRNADGAVIGGMLVAHDITGQAMIAQPGAPVGLGVQAGR